METKKLTPEQKKGVLIAGGALLFLHFLPSIANSVHQLFVKRPTPPPMQVRIPAAPVQQVVEEKASYPPLTDLVGKFAGQQLQPDLQNCRVFLEVKPFFAQTGYYPAYETRSCAPSPIGYRGPLTAAKAGQLPNIIEGASPVNTSMSGSLTDGVMNFRVDLVVGGTVHHCGPRSYSISPFGTAQTGMTQVMAQWEEPSPCSKSGHMLLIKQRA